MSHQLNQLIPVTTQHFEDGENNPVVNGRDLYEWLEVQTPFSMWVKRRIEEYDFTQGTDFVVINNFVNDESVFGGKRKIADYFITLDMAKELAMVERTSKGKEARKYFIACEKALREQPKQPQFNTAFMQRAMLNRPRIKQGYFSVIDVVSDRVIAPLEQFRTDFPEKFCPDISVGLLWSRYLKSTGRSPESVGAIKYKHKYQDGRHCDAWQYPNAMYEEFMQWLYSDWIAVQMKRYLSGSDKTLLITATEASKSGWLSNFH